MRRSARPASVIGDAPAIKANVGRRRAAGRGQRGPEDGLVAKRSGRADQLLVRFHDGYRRLHDELTVAGDAERSLQVTRALCRLIFACFIGRPEKAAGDELDAARIFFASFAWSLRSECDAITPDALGTLLEKEVHRRTFNAYYSPPEITAHLCERTIHGRILDRVNKARQTKFATIEELVAGLDETLVARLRDEILPTLSVLDPACGSGAFLVAALNTLVPIYVAGARVSPLEATRRIVRDNLYGVDLMPEAVEITRLRLSLSLAACDPAEAELRPDLMLVSGNALIGQLDSPGGDQTLLEQFRQLKIRHERIAWNAERRRPGASSKRPTEIEDVRRLRPLHWPTAFGDVMKRGGFDVVIANPPWDVLKPNGKEFFEVHSSLVTKKSMTIGDFVAEQGRLLEDAELRDAWLDYLSTFARQSAYFRAAPEYAHQSAVAGGKRVGSDLNLYKLFTERCYRLLCDGGQCGLVVPSGIYTDLGAKGLREMLFSKTTIGSLFCFENRDGVFDDVHRMFKFVVLRFKRGGETRSFPAAFMRHDVTELASFPGQGGVTIDVDLVRRLSPDSLSVMEFKSEFDVSIARKMSRFPLLGEDVPDRWRLKLTREFDMTNDGWLFETSPGDGRLPLFEGKMIWQFDDRFAGPRYWVDEAAGRAALCGIGIPARDLGTQTGMPVPQYKRSRFAIRAVASNVNARTLIAAIVPANHFCGNSLLVDAGGLDEAESLYLAGVMNSFVLDWLLRQKVTTNVNMFQVYQLPVPRLVAGEEAFDAIVRRVTKLMAGEANDPSRAELEAIVARLYGLIPGEFAHILQTFPLIDAREREQALSC